MRVAAQKTRERAMPVFEAENPLDEMKPHNFRFPAWLLLKLKHIARVERARGAKSPYTKRKVAMNDVAISGAVRLVENFEKEHGEIPVSADDLAREDDEDDPPAKTKKPSPKKAGR